MRVLPSLAAIVVGAALAGGCADEDDPYPIRPGGGGQGSGSAAPDAGPGPDGAAGTLTGQVCVVLQWDEPVACPAVNLRQDVLVELAGTATATTSDELGQFSLPVSADGVTLRLGAELADGLTATFSSFGVGVEPVAAPVVDELLWLDTLGVLLESDTLGAIVAYVVDTTGAPVPGALVSFVGAPPPNARLYYDDGAGGWIPDDGLGTGLDGIALILDAGDATLAITLGERVRQGAVVTDPGSIGMAMFVLPD